MMPRPRLSKRTAWFLAAGCSVLAVVAIGLAVWLSRSSSAAAPIFEAQVVKLLMADEGIASVKPVEIGWGGVDLATLRVRHDDVALPTWIDGDTLRFYAPISPTRYMSETVFWLERGDQPGAEITEQPIEPRSNPGPIDHYTATLRVEENHVYSPQVIDGDHWFWAQLPAPITRTIPLTLTAVVAAPAHLTIDVWGSTAAPTNNRSRLSHPVERSAAGRVCVGRTGATHDRGGRAGGRAARRRQ